MYMYKIQLTSTGSFEKVSAKLRQIIIKIRIMCKQRQFDFDLYKNCVC